MFKKSLGFARKDCVGMIYTLTSRNVHFFETRIEYLGYVLENNKI